MNNEINYIDTSKILEGLKNFEPRFYGDEPRIIHLNPEDIRYLLANMGFPIEKKKYGYEEFYEIFGLRIYEDDKLTIGEFKLFGVPRLKKWQ